MRAFCDRRPAALGRCVALCLILIAGAAFAQAVSVIELRNRPADELLPILTPLMTGGGSIAASGFTLIVRTTPANLAELRRVIESLDRARRQLLVSVRQDHGASAAAGGVGAEVSLGADSGRVRGNVAGSLYERTSTAEDNVVQQVRVLEGNPASINTGSSIMVPQRSVTRTVNGVIVRERAVQRDFSSGFTVTPRVSGNQVSIEIGVARDTPVSTAGSGTPAPGQAGAASINRVASTVTGTLGEWIELSVVGQASTSQSRGVLARSSEAGSQERRVYVRVQEVR